MVGLCAISPEACSRRFRGHSRLRWKVIGMHVELSRTYPVPRHRGFEYFMDVRSWTDWTTMDIVDREAAVWENPGDKMRYTRKTSLPGFPLKGEVVLDEVTSDELVLMTLTTTGLPVMPVECRFADAGPGAFTLTLTVHTDDPTGFMWEALERLLFIETLTARDMRSCLDGLEVLCQRPGMANPM